MLERKSFVNLKIFVNFKNTRVTLSSQTLTFEDQLNKLSELVNVSKNKLKVFAILLLSVKNSLFSPNAIFDSPKEYLFEKYRLQLFQNGFRVYPVKMNLFTLIA